MNQYAATTLARPQDAPFFHATYEVARKEAMQHLRTKRLVILAAIMLLSLVLTTIVVPTVLGMTDPNADFSDIGARENMALLFFLNAPIIGGIFLLQLLGIVLTSDGICSEWQRKTVFLVLSKPVSRSAFVLGKFFGAVLPLIALLVVVLGVDYLLLEAIMPGHPSADEVARFFGMMGLLALGTMAFASMGLLFSALTRSTVVSLILALTMAIVVFPMVASISDFVLISDDDFGGRDVDADALKYDISHYFTPASTMMLASDAVVEEDIPVAFSFLFPQSTPDSIGGAIASSFAFTIGFVGLSLWAVQRRDFE